MAIALLALSPCLAGARGIADRARARSPLTNLAALTSLRNYSFFYTASNLGASIRSVGAVHDPTDWRLATGSVTTYDVGGHGYSVVKGFSTIEHTVFHTRFGYQHLNGEQTWGTALLDTTHVTGMRISRGSSCRIAGVPGTVYTLKTPGADKGIFSAADQACVADRSGALLSFAEGVTGGGAAKTLHLSGAHELFEVTGIGRVGVIRAPR